MIEIVAPLVISRPMPRRAYIVAKVMMKGGRPICTMPKAWNTPMNMPMANEIATAPAIEEAKPRSCVSSQATIMLMKPATAPTERSMPPVMMTKVSPMARIAIIAPCRNKLAMLLEVQNVRGLDRKREPHQEQQPEQGQAQEDIEPGAVSACFGQIGVAHTNIIPVCLSDADGFGEDRLMRSVLVAVRRCDGAAPEHVQRVGQFVDLGQIG